MYPHRLVVDANCINAKGRMLAMNALEKYHHAGALELIVTSTLPAELDKNSIQARKARLYQAVGGHLFYFHGEKDPQSSIGAPVRKSLLPLLHQELFGRNLTGHALLRAIRDCLHLDQAQMNAADIFVTNDKRLRAAEPLLARHGVDLSIRTPEQALVHVRNYYCQVIGSDDLEKVKKTAHDQGLVILGSNSFSAPSFSFIAGRSEETLARIKIEGGLLHIGGCFRDERGQLLLELKPGEQPVFPDPGPGRGVRLMQVGCGPILVDENLGGSAVVASETQTYLAVRITHTRRAVISEMKLRDDAGQLVVAIDKKILKLQGAGIRFS